MATMCSAKGGGGEKGGQLGRKERVGRRRMMVDVVWEQGTEEAEDGKQADTTWAMGLNREMESLYSWGSVNGVTLSQMENTCTDI